METELIRCNNCSASLEVPSSARFVTCSQCETHLAVKRTSSVTYTEVLQKINQKNQPLSEQIEDLSLENKLMRLDREWEREREKYMMTRKNGTRYFPTETSSILGGVFSVSMGILFIYITSSISCSAFIPLFGLVLIAIGIGIGAIGYQKSQNYQLALRDHERRRRELLSQQHQPEKGDAALFSVAGENK